MADINARIDLHIYLHRELVDYVMNTLKQAQITSKAQPKLIPQKLSRQTLRKWREQIRGDLYDLTGADIVLLATQKVTRYVWGSIYSMSCAKCGKTWADGVALARHHRIPIKLGRALGLSGKRLGVPDNLVCLCVEEYLEADRAVRKMVKERYPDLYCWGT